MIKSLIALTILFYIAMNIAECTFDIKCMMNSGRTFKHACKVTLKNHILAMKMTGFLLLLLILACIIT